MGRFINGDALASTGQGVLGNNMFAYCGNNPVLRFDPTGCCWEILFFRIDCLQPECPTSKNYGKKRIALFFDNRQSGILNGIRYGEGFSHQADQLGQRLSADGYVDD